MMNHIHLSDHEAKNINRISVLIRPIDLQEGCSDLKLCTVNKDQSLSEHGFGVLYKEPRHKWIADDKPCFEFKRCPYTVGQKVGLKESWACDEMIGLLYKAHYFDSKDEQEVAEHYGACPEWESPVTMPLDFIRHRRIITGIKVKRLQELTNEECRRLGWSEVSMCAPYYWFRNEWQTRYAKTKFAWENNPYVWLYEIEK